MSTEGAFYAIINLTLRRFHGETFNATQTNEALLAIANLRW